MISSSSANSIFLRLTTLNRQFTDWAESEYNAVEHNAIGMKPIDRFGMDLSRVRFLSPSEHNDELFYAEATRKVKKDNTFQLSKIGVYETPVDLRDKPIEIRYDRHQNDDPAAIVIYYKGQRMGIARLLDAVANGLLPKKGPTAMMIRTFYGLTQDPFDSREIQLLATATGDPRHAESALSAGRTVSGPRHHLARARPSSSSPFSQLPENANTSSLPSRGLCTLTPTRSRFFVRPSASSSKATPSNANGNSSSRPLA